MKLSIIIPCYNEKAFLSEIIKRVKNSPVAEKEIILVDDASKDGTIELIRSELEAEVDRVIYHQRNLGKGAAIRSAISLVTGDIVIIQDADLEYDPQDYPKLMDPITDGRADVVYGSRFLEMKRRKGFKFWHYIGNRFLTRLSNIFTGLNLSDMETCYKLFKREILQNIKLEQDGFGIEPEITGKVARMGYRVHEVAISYDMRSYCRGKKITWKDGLWAIYCILKYR